MLVLCSCGSECCRELVCTWRGGAVHRSWKPGRARVSDPDGGKASLSAVSLHQFDLFTNTQPNTRNLDTYSFSWFGHL